MNPFVGVNARTVEEVSIKFIENVFQERRDGYILEAATAIQFMDMIDNIAATMYPSCVDPEVCHERANMLTWANNLCDTNEHDLKTLTSSYWNLLQTIRRHFT